MKIVVTKKDALTIIDGQNDFVFINGALYVSGVEGESDNIYIVTRLGRLWQLSFGYKTKTRDIHPEKRHVEYDIFGRHCVEDTKGAEYYSPLEYVTPGPDEDLVKGLNSDLISYSIEASPAFPEHTKALREKSIERVFLAGWAFRHCVAEAAIVYAIQGFEVYIIRDCTRSVAPPYDKPEMDEILKLRGVKLINSADIE